MLDVVGVNVGTPRLLAVDRGTKVYSAIAKRPVPGGTVLWLSLGNLSGDAQADLSVHGGPDKAVYAYPSEHLQAWESDLGERLGDAPFGENLSTRGATEAAVHIGDRWRWDQAVLEVCQPRSPCAKLALHRGRRDVQALMRATGRSGWYLRVLEPGEVTVGSRLEVIELDGAALSVAAANAAMADRHLEDRHLVEALAKHERLAAEWGDPLRERLGRH